MNTQVSEPLNTLSDRGKLILKAAQKLFLQHGYDNTSLEMIIAESGGSRRNIYGEFGNKAALLKAVVQEQVNQQVFTLKSIDYSLPPEQALQDVCMKFVKGFLSETLLGLFRLVVNIIPKHPEIGDLVYQQGPLSGVKPVGEYLHFLQEKHVIEVDDLDFAGQMLIEMVKGRLHLRALLQPNTVISDQEIYDHIERAIGLFLKAYTPK